MGIHGLLLREQVMLFSLPCLFEVIPCVLFVLWKGIGMIEENLDIKQSNDFIKALIQKQSRRKLVELTQNTDCSMDQLARLSGVNEEVLSAMINGEREITPNMLARILDVYNYFGEEDLLFNQMVC